MNGSLVQAGGRQERGGEQIDSRLKLNLEVTDPEIVSELVKHDEGPERDGYALSALRLGVLTLQHARGELDVQTLRQTGERLVSEIRIMLLEQANGVTNGVAASLAHYLDPTSGALPQRLERLVQKDGELDALLSRHLTGDASQLAQTLARHVGDQSPLIRMLSPAHSDGLLAALAQEIERALGMQRDSLLQQFSLDHPGSALSRLVQNLTDVHGRLKDDFKKDLSGIVKEFSLDDPGSALSRLVRQVDRAQKGIAEQFSLDLEDSSLSRLKRELVSTLDRLDAEQKRFQGEVRTTLAAFQARREEAARSTRHGGEFEDTLSDALGVEVRKLGDVFTRVGNTTGKIKHCKLGDCVAELNAETAAPGERIVVEAKAAAGQDVSRALEALRTARENRDAQVGIFVIAKKSAPEGLEPLNRYSQDIIVVWDEENPLTDVYLRAAYSLARYMLIRRIREEQQTVGDLGVMDEAIAEVGRRIKSLDEITTLAQTISSNSTKILDRTRIVREAVDRQLEVLNQHLGALRRR